MSLVVCIGLCLLLEGVVMTNFEKLVADAEASRGLPTGLLSAIVHQETGGKQDYIVDPAKYHYAPNKKGVRVAKHTGKVSTAFGPFGLLESTSAKPGYGVVPLKDKSLEEQIRFAADYLGARIKHAGSVAAGLAGYGEGDKYAKSVLSRVKGVPVSVQEPLRVQETSVKPPPTVMDQIQENVVVPVTNAVNTGLDRLGTFVDRVAPPMPVQVQEPVAPPQSQPYWTMGDWGKQFFGFDK